MTAQNYYDGNNEEITRRMGYLERQTRGKINVKFHKLKNMFFAKAVKRLVMYLMGNGADFESAAKDKIDRRFDRVLIQATIDACVDGVVWIFPDVDRLNVFRSTEFVPLFEERTNKALAGIRFWRVSEKKPMYIELYEVDGVTKYRSDENGGQLFLMEPKRPYKQKIRRDAFSTEVIDGENYGVFPIFSLYANERHVTELSPGLKALIDAHDFISSDLVDTITHVEGVYWIIRNYMGQEGSDLISEIQDLKIAYAENPNGNVGVDNHVIEAPYNAKEMSLEKLERDMYATFLMPDNRLTSGNATATEIKMAREEIDMKSDLLEWQVSECIENILRLKGLEGVLPNSKLPNFKRRTTVNDSEMVQNISASMSGAPWRTFREAILDDPTIPTEEKDERIKLMELSETGVPVEDEGTEDTEEIEGGVAKND